MDLGRFVFTTALDALLAYISENIARPVAKQE